MPIPLASPSPLLGSSFWLQQHATVGPLKWLPAFSREGCSHSAPPVTQVALTHLLRLSSVISSSRRFRRLLQVGLGPSTGFPESLVLGSNQSPYLAGPSLFSDLRLLKTVTDSLVLPGALGKFCGYTSRSRPPGLNVCWALFWLCDFGQAV